MPVGPTHTGVADDFCTSHTYPARQSLPWVHPRRQPGAPRPRASFTQVLPSGHAVVPSSVQAMLQAPPGA
jgi:hypothetical protein